MAKYLLFLVAVLMSLEDLQAQERFLLLYRIGTQREARFHEQEVINFQLKGEQEFFRGVITGFTDTEIKFNSVSISLDSIQAIDIRGKNFSKSGIGNTIGSKLITAGLGYLALDWFNRTVVSGGQGGFSSQVLTASGIMVGTGVIFNLLKRKHFVVDHRHRMMIVDQSRVRVSEE